MTNVTHKTSKCILILGAGNFGTCLAQHLAEQNHHVVLWDHIPDIVDAINTSRKNPKYLSTIILSKGITATNFLSKELFQECQLVVHATPTQTMREVLNKIRHLWTDAHLLVCAAKGIEIGTLKFPSEIIASVLGTDVATKAAVLSGPSFASEVVVHQPTAVAMASRTLTSALEAQRIFHSPLFRVYTSSDPLGLEIAGALKNVVAIAAGASRGLGFMENSRAALITRGLAEITRVGVALGANPLTFKGLGGVGDLFLTCSSEKSRNFSVGYRLGAGESLSHVLNQVGVAEGVSTAKAAYQLGRHIGVETPIIDEVYQVLYENKEIKRAVRDLIERAAKPELDDAPGF